MIAGLIAIAKAGATVGAQAGAAYGTQTLLGKVFGDQSSKKAANFANDVSENTQHGNNFFDSIKSGVQATYRALLSDEEIEGLRNNILPSVQSDPYFGGLGNSYSSPYAKATFATVPAVGIAQTIDKYLDARDKQTSTAAANNSSGLINYDDLFTQIKKDLGLAPKATEENTLATAATAPNYTNYMIIGALLIGGILLIRRK